MTYPAPGGSGHPGTAGYQALGDLMGAYPQIAIFRGFRNAGALDLLYRQAELQQALALWADNAETNRTSTAPSRPDDPDRRLFDLSFELLQSSADLDDIEVGDEWRAWRNVREKLSQYYERLLTYQRICGLPQADGDHLRQLCRHLRDEDKGDNFLSGIEKWPYNDVNKEDLISVSPSIEPDILTKFSRGRAVNLIHKHISGDGSERSIMVPKLGTDTVRSFWFKEYSPKHAMISSRILIAILTSMLVTFAITTLNVMQSMMSRITLIAFHNLIFTIAMAVFTHARPGELFGVAAAYAAVLVVYASGSFGPDGKTETR